MNNTLKTYTVKFINNQELKFTGIGDHILWKNAAVLSDFSSPWEKEPITKTTFRALLNDTHLFFYFDVEDTSIHVNKTCDTNKSINVSDRVELFFRTNKNLNPYYCLEIDSTPRIMDFKAQPNKVFDFDWNWPKSNITVKSNRTKLALL